MLPNRKIMRNNGDAAAITACFQNMAVKALRAIDVRMRNPDNTAIAIFESYAEHTLRISCNADDQKDRQTSYRSIAGRMCDHSNREQGRSLTSWRSATVPPAAPRFLFRTTSQIIRERE